VKSISLDPFSELWALVLNLVKKMSKWAILDPIPHKNNFEIFFERKKFLNFLSEIPKLTQLGSFIQRTQKY
jgi:hypothetical protein